MRSPAAATQALRLGGDRTAFRGICERCRDDGRPGKIFEGCGASNKGHGAQVPAGSRSHKPSLQTCSRLSALSEVICLAASMQC